MDYEPGGYYHFDPEPEPGFFEQLLSEPMFVMPIVFMIVALTVAISLD